MKAFLKVSVLVSLQSLILTTVIVSVAKTQDDRSGVVQICKHGSSFSAQKCLNTTERPLHLSRE